MVLAGAEYGTGSSRDWAAKGTFLLGVRAVLAASFERIHRSNLVGMGVLPLELPPGKPGKSLGLSGEEVFDIAGPWRSLAAGGQTDGPRHRAERQSHRIPRHDAHRHAGRTGILSERRNSADGGAETIGRNVTFSGRGRLSGPVVVSFVGRASAFA